MLQSFHPRKDPTKAIEQALDRAIELSVGTRHYTITDGRLVYEPHRRYRSAYTLTQGSWDLPDGTDLQLSSSDLAHSLPVQPSTTKDESVTITVTQRLTERTLASAQLVVDRAFLLRKLKEDLLCESTSAQCGLKLLGVLDCADGEAEAHLVETIKEVFSADEAQLLAMRRALYSELLMVLGPPGTGKTDVLAAIALLHATLFSYRVLIVWKKEVPRPIYHSKGNAEHSQELMQQCFDEYERRLRNKQPLLPAVQPPHPPLLGEREERREREAQRKKVQGDQNG